MAAATDAPAPRVVELRQIGAASLDALLSEETALWMDRLSWDFSPSASLVRRYVSAGSLDGYALLCGAEAAGYVYFVYEGRKGLIGDLYIKAAQHSLRYEAALLRAALQDLFRLYRVERVESQLLFLRAPGRYPLPLSGILTTHLRYFMVCGLDVAARLPAHPHARHAMIVNWTAHHQEEAAGVIARAYADHIDSQVNDQYRSLAGARRFLNNIVQYPGCGVFCQPASFVAMDAVTGELCGLSLASTLAPRVGHITQICAVPRWQGRGLGYELLRRSLLALAETGCTRASLTVTASNAAAVRLYERVGFRCSHKFSALVWQK